MCASNSVFRLARFPRPDSRTPTCSRATTRCSSLTPSTETGNSSRTNSRVSGSGTWTSSASNWRRCFSISRSRRGNGSCLDRESRSTDLQGDGSPDSARELLVELSALDILRQVLREFSFHRHAHRDAGPHDLEDPGLQGLRQGRVRLHVRDPDRLRKRQVADPGLAGVSRSLLDLQFLRDQGGRRRRPDLDGEGLRLRVNEQGDGDLHPLERFRLLVDRLEDLDDVHAERTERGSEGWTGRRLAAIDEDLEYLHHGPASARVAVSVQAYTFGTLTDGTWPDG